MEININKFYKMEKISIILFAFLALTINTNASNDDLNEKGKTPKKTTNNFKFNNCTFSNSEDKEKTTDPYEKAIIEAIKNLKIDIKIEEKIAERIAKKRRAKEIIVWNRINNQKTKYRNKILAARAARQARLATAPNLNITAIARVLFPDNNN
jgi:hypothetical protein